MTSQSRLQVPIVINRPIVYLVRPRSRPSEVAICRNPVCGLGEWVMIIRRLISPKADVKMISVNQVISWVTGDPTSLCTSF